jgi:hypothetical protein
MDDAAIQVRAALDGVGVVWTLEHYRRGGAVDAPQIDLIESCCSHGRGGAMRVFEVVAALLLGGAALAALARRIGAPYPALALFVAPVLLDTASTL